MNECGRKSRDARLLAVRWINRKREAEGCTAPGSRVGYGDAGDAGAQNVGTENAGSQLIYCGIECGGAGAAVECDDRSGDEVRASYCEREAGACSRRVCGIELSNGG